MPACVCACTHIHLFLLQEMSQKAIKPINTILEDSSDLLKAINKLS